MVGLLLPSDFVGRPGRNEAPYDVVAATDVTLCLFRKPSFEALLRDTPSVERRLLELTLDELDAAREWMIVLGRKTARERIASFLSILARRNAVLNRTQPHNGMSFDLILTREAIADYLGMTIETVSRQFTALRKDGVISLEGTRKVTVMDFVRLMDEAGDDSDGGMLG